ncbi:MAG: ABC transporter permease [Oceanipulchritudo sp.]
MRRLRALVRKEFLQVGRDPSSILIAFIIPLILLFIFGYGLSLDSKNLRVGLVIESVSGEASEFAAALRGSGYFEVRGGTDLRAFEDLLARGQLRGIIVLPEDFARHVRGEGKEAAFQIITDGSEPQIAAFVENYTRGVWLTWNEQRRYQEGFGWNPPITVEQRYRYNPAVRSRNFLIPGSIAVIMTIVGALLTALVVAREWERGTMEALLASPVTRAELIIGKIIPYFILGMGSFAVCVLTAVFLFKVPLQGSLFALTITTSLFLLTALGMGLGISAGTRDQFLAAQIALNVAFLPAFILSGFVFEIKSMPLWIQAITYIIPARYFVSSLKSLFLAGDIWSILLPNLLFLLLASIVFLGLTARNMARKLD